MVKNRLHYVKLIHLILFLLIFTWYCDSFATTSVQRKQPIKPHQKQLLSKELADVPKKTDEQLSNIERNVESSSYKLISYKPTYVLPFYYTATPYDAIYKNNIPRNQKLMQTEFKGQFSFQVPLIPHLFSKKNSLNFGYTQESFWQAYNKSAFFRESNYAPELFLRSIINTNFTSKLGVIHQSNGCGYIYERSWNRVYGEAIFSGKNWMLSLEPWLRLRESKAKDHNPNIEDYLGNGRVLLVFKLGSNTLSLTTRNNIQSHFKRGAEKLTWSFPLTKHVRGLVEVFSGYGQSLIEYNHYTNTFALGISISDWM